jgi:hypothetical protein
MKPLIHPIWAIVALPALVLLLGSDITNNLSIVHLFASGELSLYSWQSLSIGVALAAGVLGYAASRKVWYWFPCLVVTLISGSLTMLSVGSDFATQTAGADSYEITKQGLILEREQLLKSLNGTPSCAQQGWCDSQAKERRVAAINAELATTAPQIDPLATRHGEVFAQAIAWLRAFGIPLIISILGNLLGEIFKGSVKTATIQTQQSPTPPDGGKKKNKKGFTESFTSEKNLPPRTPANTAPVTAELKSVQPKSATNTATEPDLRGFRHDTGVNDEGASRYRELKKNVISGKVRPSLRQVRAHCKCRQDIAQKYLRALGDEGVIERKGQGWQLAQRPKLKLVN